MEVQACNMGERAFSIFTLVLCFVMAAAFVSSITTSMTRLEVIGVKQQTQFSMLRRYLRLQGVSSRLVMRITRNAKFGVEQKHRQVAEGDVELLALLSEPLRIDLHFEVYSRVLSYHRLFSLYCQLNPTVMRRICHSAVSVVPACRGDVVFSYGERPVKPQMLFVLSGRMKYFHGEEAVKVETEIVRCASLCEPVLWTQWTHQGALLITTQSEFLSINAEKFQDIASHNFEFGDNTHPALYARMFVNALNDHNVFDLTDIDGNMELLNEELFAKKPTGKPSPRNPRRADGLGVFADRVKGVLRGSKLSWLSDISVSSNHVERKFSGESSYSLRSG